MLFFVFVFLFCFSSELRSFEKVEVAVLDSTPVIVLNIVSVDVKQHLKINIKKKFKKIFK